MIPLVFHKKDKALWFYSWYSRGHFLTADPYPGVTLCEITWDTFLRSDAIHGKAAALALFTQMASLTSKLSSIYNSQDYTENLVQTL